MNDSTKATLKPCPFCGGEAVFESAYEQADGTFHSAEVMCPKCRITITGESRKSKYGWANNIDYMNSRRTAIESWNRRTPAQLEKWHNMQESKSLVDWNEKFRHIMELLESYKDDENDDHFIVWDEQIPELTEYIVQEFKGEEF